jgi:dynein heavy chain 2
VDNPSDLRVLRTYVTQLYNSSMLSSSKGGCELTKGIRMPTSCSFDELTKWAHDQLPDEDSPSLFGLPENIQRAVQKALSTVVATQLRSLSVAQGGSQKFERSVWRQSLGPLIDLWSKLIEGESLKVAEAGGLAGSKKVAAMPPTDQFVIFENDTAIQLCG